MSRDQFYELFDAESDLEYHQDYREGIYGNSWERFTHPSNLFFALLLLVAAIYQACYVADYNILPLPELFWNCLVYITPCWLLDRIESYTSPLRIASSSFKLPRTHAAKSEAMRRMLGLERAGEIIGSVAQAGRRRMSVLSRASAVVEGSEDSPPGLGNWDNSCYQNSVLQGLASLGSLSGYLINPYIGEGDKAASKSDMKMADALRGLISTLNDRGNNGRLIWTPATLKNMSSWQQQDAQEYFSKVLDEIDKEFGKAAGIMRNLGGLEGYPLSSTSSNNQESLRYPVFRNPLEGLVAQRVCCTSCGYSEGLSMIPFNCLTVPLGKAWSYEVSECLDEYTKLEEIEGVECGKCTLLKFQRQLLTILERAKDSPDNNPVKLQSLARLEAVNEALEDDDYEDKTLTQKCKILAKNRVFSTKTKQAVIARPPKSLVVHFNRSQFNEMTGDLTKNHAEVRFPKVLDLGPWCLGSSGSDKDMLEEEWLLKPDQPMIAGTRLASRLKGPMYELRAVVTHYGRHENGHYICYKKHLGVSGEDGSPEKEQWWRLSDDDVMKVSEENVLGQGGVFMLFFDLIIPSTPTAQASDIAMEVTVLSDLEVAREIPLPRSPTPSDNGTADFDMPNGPEMLATTQQVSLDPKHLEIVDVICKGSSSPMIRGDSQATSTSGDDEEEFTQQQQEYAPTKAIIVPPYSGARSKEGTTGQQELSPGSLVMV